MPATVAMESIFMPYVQCPKAKLDTPLLVSAVVPGYWFHWMCAIHLPCSELLPGAVQITTL